MTAEQYRKENSEVFKTYNQLVRDEQRVKNKELIGKYYKTKEIGYCNPTYYYVIRLKGDHENLPATYVFTMRLTFEGFKLHENKITEIQNEMVECTEEEFMEKLNKLEQKIINFKNKIPIQV